MADTPGERIVRLEKQMKDLVGNGQKGKIAELDERLKASETFDTELKAFFKYARFWGPLVAAALAFTTGGGRFTLEGVLKWLGV